MVKLRRRRLLRVGGGVATGLLAGCLSVDGQPSTGSPARTGETTGDAQTTGDAESLTDWERSTDCDGMHDSTIRVERVRTDLGGEYAPIHFADLSPEERTILRTVTGEGGYGTCDTSEAFQQFVGRVSDHAERQEADRMRIYLERGGTYYGLYVEDLDQVYAY
ncbi:MAG: hypothetical protein ABEJ22_03635 [Haloferacaceae archaeon]